MLIRVFPVLSGRSPRRYCLFYGLFQISKICFYLFVCFVLNLFLKANPVSIKSLLGVYLLVKEDYGKLECTDSSFEAPGAPML